MYSRIRDKVDKNADMGVIEKCQDEIMLSFAGNPNVGKSTIFNALTGLKQHTGNWAGKTISNAVGRFERNGQKYIAVDLPGTYSLISRSAEEDAARNFICFSGQDCTVIVCDATCIRRNLNLVLQIMEITGRVVVCVNLIDEAEKRGISVDVKALSAKLKVPVIATNARKNEGLDSLLEAVQESISEKLAPPLVIKYEQRIEDAIDIVEPLLRDKLGGKISTRWAALRLIEGDEAMLLALCNYMQLTESQHNEIAEKLAEAREKLNSVGISDENFSESIVTSIIKTADNISAECVKCISSKPFERDRKIDRFLTSRLTGIPIMLAVLFLVFWLTIVGANYPSAFLSKILFGIEDWLMQTAVTLGVPEFLRGMLIDGMFRVLAWVVAVMLPPMAIFFPFFTILEDLGYLPRIAFNLDKYFQKACTCGKQALTMCMGFGCNAAGVSECRIIDSPRERLIAILTNSFVPCNGRLPTLIAIITMFFIGISGGIKGSILSTALLTLTIVFGIFMTFMMSRLLSKTILKGVPSSFTLELPPYRKPQIGKIIVRSIFDRTLFVLGRAVVIAAPAGIIIWLMANVTVDGNSLLYICSSALDPFARIIGLDGVILLAFILGFPANEIVVPIIIMAYMQTGSLIEIDNLSQLKELLTANGWTWVTALCTMLFSLMHWPCSTTCLTIGKETGSFKWTVISILLPTAAGVLICFIVASAAKFIGLQKFMACF